VTTLGVSTDKKAYGPGEPVTVTLSGDGQPGTAMTVTVTVEAGSQTAVTSWTQLPAAAETTAFTAAVVPSGYGGAEPTVASVPGSFTWMGYTWEPQNWGTAPGQPVAAQAAVNAAGDLVLTASTLPAGYRGAETDSARGDQGIMSNPSTWGYGTYTWIIGTDLSTLPAGLVLGMFTFWGTGKGGPAGQKEIDIELGTQGVAAAPIAQMGFYADTAAGIIAAVPPLHTLVAGSQAAVKSAPATTVQFTWLPGSITWDIWYGTVTTGKPDYTVTMTEGQKYQYTQPFGGAVFTGTVNIPATGGQQVVMNLWSTGEVALPGSTQVIIRSFSYAPHSGTGAGWSLAVDPDGLSATVTAPGQVAITSVGNGTASVGLI
jgi:hypothetical protein